MATTVPVDAKNIRFVRIYSIIHGKFGRNRMTISEVEAY
jgi:hypothetical protein